MKILLITICYNEEKMLPHFLKYYSKYCDKIIVCDGGSTDKSHEIIKANPKCELNLDYVSDKADDIQFLEIKNELWKKYRDEYDWCIVVDIDEFLFSFDGLMELFKQADAKGASLICPKGYDMYSAKSLKEDSDLFFDFPNGIPFDNSSKMCAFNIKKLDSINYLAGCHRAQPFNVGPFVGGGGGLPPITLEFPASILLHYRFLGLGDVLQKKHLAESRLSERNKQNGFGIHNLTSDDAWIHRFNEGLKNSKPVL